MAKKNPLSAFEPFLVERTPRTLTLPRQFGLEPKALFIGLGQNALEVAVVAAAKPAAGALQTAWKARHNLTWLLRGGDRRTALGILLNPAESWQPDTGRYYAHVRAS